MYRIGTRMCKNIISIEYIIQTLEKHEHVNNCKCILYVSNGFHNWFYNKYINKTNLITFENLKLNILIFHILYTVLT